MSTTSSYDPSNESPLVLTASNDAAEEALQRGLRAESIFSFKHRLHNALDPAQARHGKALRIVQACVLAGAAKSETVGWTARARTATILRELQAFDASSTGASLPTSGYAAKLRALFSSQLGNVGKADLARLVRAASPARMRDLVGGDLLVRGIFRFADDDLALLAALQGALTKVGAEVLVEVPGASQQRLDFTHTDPFGQLADAVVAALQSPPVFVEAHPSIGNAATAAADGKIKCIAVRDEWGAAEAAVQHVQAAFRSGKVALTDMALVVSDLDSVVLSPLLSTLAAAQLPAIDPRGFEVDQAEVIWAAGRIVELAWSATPRDIAELFGSPAIDVGIPAVARRDLMARLRASSIAKVPHLHAFYTNEVETFGVDLASQLSGATHAVSDAQTRGEALAALSRLWSTFGLARSADRGATQTLRKDAPPDAIELRELHVVAREGAYMRALADAIATYRSALEHLGALDTEADASQTAREIFALLPKRLPPLPAARAARLKIATLAEASGLAAKFVVVVDAARDAGRSENAASGRATNFSAELWGLVHTTRRTTFILPTFLAGAVATPWEEIASAPRFTHTPARVDPEDKSSAAMVAARVAVEAERERYFLSPRRVTTETIGKLPANVLLRAYVPQSEAHGSPRPMPVTTLEAFATCAFRGYAEHVLFAREKPVEGLTLAARDEGALLHEICAKVFERTRDLWSKRPRPTGEILDALEAVVDGYVQLTHDGSLRRVELGYARILARQVLLSSILEEDWDYVLSEQAFGAKDATSWPPLELPLAGAVLSGRIDRIDQSRDRKSYRVIDYKRGKQEEKLVGVTALQLPLYARVVEMRTHLPVVEGTYWRLVGQGTGRKAVSPKTWPHLQEEAMDRAEQTFASVRGGNIEPRPYLPSTCQTCAVAGICRRPPFAIPEVAGDP